MDRILIGTAAGGLALYLLYLIQTGESPKVVQRVVSTIPAPRTDSTKEPAMSGSASSIVTAVANTGIDPHVDARPTELGGDLASTGTELPQVTQQSLDLTPLRDEEPIVNERTWADFTPESDLELAILNDPDNPFGD